MEFIFASAWILGLFTAASALMWIADRVWPIE